MKRDLEVWNEACRAWYDKGTDPSSPFDRATKVVADYRKEVERAAITKVVRWLEQMEKDGRLVLKCKGGIVYETISSGDSNGFYDTIHCAPSVSAAVRLKFLQRGKRRTKLRQVKICALRDK